MKSITLILLTGTLVFFQLSSYAKTIGPQAILLWELGRSDNDNTEFFLAPDGFHQYKDPGIHIVGATDPANSWPYILPGPLDLWAGNSCKPFEIRFYLETVKQGGDFILTIDFLDTHSFKPPKLKVQVNRQVFEHQTTPGNNDWLVASYDSSGREQIVRFNIPYSAFFKGENIITVTAIEGSWALWDAISMEAPAGNILAMPEKQTFIHAITDKPVLLKEGKTLVRPLYLELIHAGMAQVAEIKTGSVTQSVRLLPGRQTVEVLIPETLDTAELQVMLTSEGKVIATASKIIEPVRHWEVHLIHQTHLDIGFTHTQEEVLRMQLDYLYQALDLIEKTRDYPDAAKFRWHAEGMWAVDEFMRTAPEQKKQQFIQALKDQSIHLDAFYIHMLTGLATDEELIELMQPAKEFETKYGIPVITALGSDIPGYSWGLVTAMSRQGIKFLNMAPNNNHRLGYLYHWADQPFFWLGPDGNDRVLTWMASNSYIYFWEQEASLEMVPRFLESLKNRDFPYDIAMLRYEVGGDNGHPDPGLSVRVKEWNEKYEWPKIIISTNSRLYHSFIERYENKIPVLSGDLTPYWEDGAVSTSADLSASRQAGERILQAHALQCMLSSEKDLTGEFTVAWKNILMYDEHTWGAWSSVSDPFIPFTVQQDLYKQKFALDAQDHTIQLVKDIIADNHKSGSGVIDVYNTSSWVRSGLVFLSREQSSRGDLVMDEKGSAVPSQRLAEGELVFKAENIPAFGARRYKVQTGKTKPDNPFVIDQAGISNGIVRIEIDRNTGAISGISIIESGTEFAGNDDFGGVNGYRYMLGRDEHADWQGIKPPVSVVVEDAGPLVGTLRIESGAAGCDKLIRRVRLAAGQAGIELINTMVKDRVLEPEGAYFAFPLNIPGGQARINIPWGVVRPETDQLQGANKNFYPVQRWVDISNEDMGLTWVTVDAPMIQFDPIRIIGKGRGDGQIMSEYSPEGIRLWWNKYALPSQTFYSWVMSNHWELNYKAFQEGEITFRYVLLPHENGYDGIAADKIAREACQPLIAVEADPAVPVISPSVFFISDQLVVTSLRRAPGSKDCLVRLYNPSASRGIGVFIMKVDRKADLFYCDPSGNPLKPAESAIELQGYGVATIRIICKDDPSK
jgi:hypothetical protein